MSEAPLSKLAEAAGLVTAWTDAFDRPRHLPAQTQRRVLEAMGLAASDARQINDSLRQLQETQRHSSPPPLLTGEADSPRSLAGYFDEGSDFHIELQGGGCQRGRLGGEASLPPLPPGYHRLLIRQHSLTLAVAPPRCPGVEEVSGQPDAALWGLTVQLYGLRREGDRGLGDSLALSELAMRAAAEGADALVVSPIHAMFGDDGRHYSPYSPSTRVFYNTLHCAPEQILGADSVDQVIEQLGLSDEIRRLQNQPLVDWPAVARVQNALLRQLYRQYMAEPSRRANLASFVHRGGEALQRNSQFQALQRHFSAAGTGADWRNWPAAYRDPDSAEVAAFVACHREEIDLNHFSQWLCSNSLQRSQRDARRAGMAIGLVSDLAVGSHPGGSQTWSRQDAFFSGLCVGAPPDRFNGNGQNWGVAAFSPAGLRATGFQAYIEMLRANLAWSGGLRIDHILGLQRLWLVPEGAPASQGAYLSYPVTDLLRLLRLEAWRHSTIVIGEDLGTVPKGFRRCLAHQGIMGTRVLLFEQTATGFIPPKQWPRGDTATTSTHDLPTIKGWFTQRDIDWRSAAGHTDKEETRAARRCRQQEIARLKQALAAQSCTAENGSLLNKCIEFVGATPSALTLLPLEDLLGSEEQANLPGPGATHPNWRRRSPQPVTALLQDEAVRERLGLLSRARHRKEGRCLP